ncbi:hypothetical protein [Roseospira navarrensis]|uniref:Uncharacterized protein n=1 Tax=Roseospira navarrensis TaxID=140058 RepID=A0A7X2D3U0_9PROT|nr:hypothetical protein [Roseospira navarrensis]MQX37734.1 hypothetical protein [Roseospira navarrensis]
MLLRLGLFTSFALLIASTLPSPLVVASLSSLLWIGALVAAIGAALRGESVHRPALTRWDEAAVLMGASLLLGFFVDEAAVAELAEGLRR